MKKIIMFGGIVVLIFVALAVVSNLQQTKKAEGNPFGKEKLHPATVELIDDPNYQNVILPEQLEEKLANEKDVTVYFYASDCPYCKEATPRVVPIAEENGIDLVQYNVKEFEEGWNSYNLKSTPTIVHFENGEEVKRLEGAVPNEEFKQFFSEYVLTN